MRRIKHPVLWILALLGLSVFVWMSGPDETPVGQVTVTREAAGLQAADFLRSKGVSVERMMQTALYEGDSEMDAYLKRHGLHGEFAKQGGRRPLAYWAVTFFRPGKDSYTVYVDETSGRVLGYELIREAGPDEPLLSEQEALALAKRELERHGVKTEKLVLAERGRAASRGNDSGAGQWREYQFAWRDTSWHVGDSRLIYEVGITGDQVTAYWTDYEIPKADQEWFAKQRTLGAILTGISLIGTILLVIFSLVVAFVYPRREVDWQRGLASGLVLLGVAVATGLNEWPQAATGIVGLDVPVDVTMWLTAAGMTALAVLSSGSTYLTAVAGGVLQERLWPGKWLRWGDAGWPQRVRAAALRGYLLALVWLGVQAIFYWVSETYFDVWQENDFTMTPWNFLVPGLFPLLAWTAGIGEEITFRLLGIGLVKRYCRSTFLALLLPAMVWALAHSLYPVHPFYTRFVELTLLGMLIGWCFLRYDLETVIFAHAIFDTVLMCLPLLFEGTWADRAWAVGWLLLPALIGRYSHLLQPKLVRQQAAA
ncbi:CPBP family glutamic-type intramembrane protease [Effusibacillus pohliae]|uniref:CPBP family glutamic-type intramembrane protease n=1 Tax=Effusibacillus pohliae TaxID=232270 RepID=UPI0003706B81|nr:type II CAAX endopeptidase family protein [Effusibacillus pohliae]